MTISRSLGRISAVAAALALVVTLGACSSQEPTKDTASAKASETSVGTWPRTVTDEKGTVKIEKAPQRIVSTTISTTGTLLAINAPVVATSKSVPGGGTVDDSGFFSQWGDVARERKVQPIYTVGEFNLEAVIAQDPDLIVVSTSGADSALDHYEELKAIAPTVVVNYGNKTWQDLAISLGTVTGHEAEAAAAVKKFDDRAAQTKAKVAIPEGTTASVVSYSAGKDSPVGKTTGPHAKLLKSLGFTVQEPPAKFDTSAQKREDFAFISYEGLSESLTGDYTFMISTDESGVRALKADKTLANVPSVKNNHVNTLGQSSFRLDYYSATNILDWFDSSFKK